MTWLAWLDTASSNAFAQQIAEEFGRNFQPGPNAPGSRATEQRLQLAIDVLGNRAAKYQKLGGLGWYRKARFMSTIKECLVERQFPAELVDRVLYAVVLRMARREG